jgi:hypothetical protein
MIEDLLGDMGDADNKRPEFLAAVAEVSNHDMATPIDFEMLRKWAKELAEDSARDI